MSFGSGPTPHQKLTPDYLARQLPVFHERVSRVQQPALKFPTNAPPNLPTPPLYPGEEIRLQQHRVVCMDLFHEPAVGALYLTNYRIIFNGNYISDPDSMDALQEVSFKKESFSFADIPRNSRSLARLTRRGGNEATFTSHITNTDSKVPESATGFQRLHSGLKKISGSLRRHPRRAGSDASALADEAGAYNFGKRMSEDQGGVVRLREDKPFYLPDTTSLDSMSVSSLSELSEYQNGDAVIHNGSPASIPLGGASLDERATLSADYFSAGGLQEDKDAEERTCSSLPIPSADFLASLPESSVTTMDSGINMAASADSSVVLKNRNTGGVKPSEKEASILLTLTASNGKELDFEKSWEKEEEDAGLEERRKAAAERGEWYRRHGSLVTPDSDSDTGEALDETLRADDTTEVTTTYSKIAIISSLNPASPSPPLVSTTTNSQPIEGGGSTEPAVGMLVDLSSTEEAMPTNPPNKTTPTAPGRAKCAVTGAGCKTPPTGKTPLEKTNVGVLVDLSEPDDIPVASSFKENRYMPWIAPLLLDENFDPVEHQHSSPNFPSSKPYLNVCVRGTGTSRERHRSSSTCSPGVKKRKPKPLPRNPRKLPTGKELREEVMTQSLPVDFTSVPVPRLLNSASSGKVDREETAASLPLGNSSSNSPLKPAPESEEFSDITAPSAAFPLPIQSKGEDTSCADIESSSPRADPQPPPPIPPPRRRRNRSSLPTSRGRRPQLLCNNSVDASTSVSLPRQDGFPDLGLSRDLFKASHDLFEEGESPTSDDVVHLTSDDRPAQTSKGSVRENKLVLPESNPGLCIDSRGLTDYLNSLSPPPNSGFPESLDDDGLTPANRNSNMSMIVNQSVSSSSSNRPHSAMLSTLDTSPTLRDSGLYPASRNGVLTWSPQARRGKTSAACVPSSTRYTLTASLPLSAIHSVKKITPVFIREYAVKLPEGIILLCRNFHSMKLHVHPQNTYDADGVKAVMEKHFMASKPAHESFAFQYYTGIRHPYPTFFNAAQSLSNTFHLSDELERLGLHKSKLWRVTKLLTERPDLSPSYPSHVIVPICTPDLDLIRGARLYREGRFPTLCWVDKGTGAALLRAAVTTTERGQPGANLELDEAFLHAICGCNEASKRDAKLYIYTEKTESNRSFKNVQAADPMHTSLTAQQVRTYYYHNCKFEYAPDPPTFKSVRHSFNKLQAMLENKLPDEDYLLALDSTHWLPRVSELLSSASTICRILCQEAASVLVCYEAGWDRTAQVVSLAQILMDPYYRTMDGIQVLIQKEWLWFGHPFRSRHNRLGREKNDGPIFLQWIDCVWQVMHQCPSAFEFNQQFLMVLTEHSYSSQFGTFIVNCERERTQPFSTKGHEHKSVSTHTVSFWVWVSMVNAAGRTFFNELYDSEAYPGVIRPRSAVPCLKLWTSHYCKYKAQENTGQASALQRQLEVLVATYKKLTARDSDGLKPHGPVLSKALSSSPPPRLGDESQEWTRHEKSSVGAGKPSAGRAISNRNEKKSGGRQYDSLEHCLSEQNIDHTICKHIGVSHNVCQGYLIKRGGVRKNWQERWFVLDFDCQYLAYFENKDAYTNKDRPKGVIHLNEIRDVFQSTKKREHLIRHIFTVETPERSYLFQAPSILTMELWMACLKLPVSSLTAHSAH